MKKYVLILILNAVIYLSSAQKTAVITGRITDSLSREPLIGAGVILADRTGTISDNEGVYLINVIGERIAITYRYLGYESKKLITTS